MNREPVLKKLPSMAVRADSHITEVVSEIEQN